MFLDQLNSVSEPGYIQLLDMAENKKMSGASSHSHKNVNKTSEPIDKWMTTLHQVRTLKSCTEDLDRKMLELQRRAEIIRRNADAAGRRRIKRPESENLTIFVGFLHLV